MLVECYDCKASNNGSDTSGAMLTMRNHALKVSTYLEFSNILFKTTNWNGKHRLVVIEKTDFISLPTTCQYPTGLDIHNKTSKAFHHTVVQIAGEAHRMIKRLVNQSTNQSATNKLLTGRVLRSEDSIHSVQVHMDMEDAACCSRRVQGRAGWRDRES